MAFYTSFIQNASKNDLYETPGSALDMILERLDPLVDFIWEPFKGTGHSTEYMRSKGFEVVNGEDPDFFNQSIPVPSPGKQLVLVSNPPFSIKKEILIRLNELNVRRVALLLPAATLYTKYFHSYSTSQAHDIQMIVHTKRCVFIDPATGEGATRSNGKKNGSASFDIAWLTHGLGLPTGINFPIVN